MCMFFNIQERLCQRASWAALIHFPEFYSPITAAQKLCYVELFTVIGRPPLGHWSLVI